jgi:C4-dicarboxylate-specific signal transduction histidine kinase
MEPSKAVETGHFPKKNRESADADAAAQLRAAKAVATQSAKLAVLGRMSACLAHELCNPLNFLVNILPEIRRDMEVLAKVRALALPAVTDPGTLAAIRTVERDADLAAHLEEMGEVFARVDASIARTLNLAGGLKTHARPAGSEAGFAKVADMVGAVLDLIPKRLREGVRIDVDLPADLVWKVDRNEIEQVFMALVNNAVDAMDGKGWILIGAPAMPGSPGVFIRDAGPGIAPEILARLFEPFFTTKPAGKGTGLGLYIASELVAKNGGSLSVDSRPGEGATFQIVMPVANPDVMKMYGNAAPERK